MSNFSFVLIILTFLLQQICADERECYFRYIRDTPHEILKERSDYSVVTIECFDKLFRFRELYVKSKSKTNKNFEWFDSKSFNGLHGVETFLDLILARGQGLFDWQTSPSKEFIKRQQLHIRHLKRLADERNQQQQEGGKQGIQQPNQKQNQQQSLAIEEATFDLDQFLDNNYVCKKHIDELVNKWADSQTHFRTLTENKEYYYCAFPIIIEGMDDAPIDPHRRVIPKNEAHHLQKVEAKFVLEKYHRLMHIGIPVCKWHQNVINAGMAKQAESSSSTSKAIQIKDNEESERE